MSSVSASKSATKSSKPNAAKAASAPAEQPKKKRSFSSSVRENRKVLARCIDDPTEVRWGRASTGTAQLALTFQLKTGGTMEWIGSFAGETSSKISRRVLRNCGWDTKTLKDLAGINENEVELDIQWEEYEGKYRQRIKWVNKPGGGRMKFDDALEPNDLDDLDAMMENIPEDD